VPARSPGEAIILPNTVAIYHAPHRRPRNCEVDSNLLYIDRAANSRNIYYTGMGELWTVLRSPPLQYPACTPLLCPPANRHESCPPARKEKLGCLKQGIFEILHARNVPQKTCCCFGYVKSERFRRPRKEKRFWILYCTSVMKRIWTITLSPTPFPLRQCCAAGRETKKKLKTCVTTT